MHPRRRYWVRKVFNAVDWWRNFNLKKISIYTWAPTIGQNWIISGHVSTISKKMSTFSPSKISSNYWTYIVVQKKQIHWQRYSKLSILYLLHYSLHTGSLWVLLTPSTSLSPLRHIKTGVCVVLIAKLGIHSCSQQNIKLDIP